MVQRSSRSPAAVVMPSNDGNRTASTPTRSYEIAKVTDDAATDTRTSVERTPVSVTGCSQRRSAAEPSASARQDVSRWSAVRTTTVRLPPTGTSSTKCDGEVGAIAGSDGTVSDVMPPLLASIVTDT